MMMKKPLLLGTLCTALALAGCNQTADTAPTVPSPESAAATADDAAEQPKMDKETLLSINGQPISKTVYAVYFQDRTRNAPEAKNSPEVQMNVLNELANVIIAAQDAEKKGIDKRPEVSATLELMRANLLAQTVIKEHADSISPSEEEIKTFYAAEYAQKTELEYKARHILVEKEEEAKSLIEKLDGGADFAELAKAHSTGPTGSNGGDLGWFDANQMVKPFSDAVTALEKGSYSKQPVQTQFGWHVILLEDSKKVEPPSLDAARPEIISNMQKKALTDYMQGMRAASDIVFNKTLEAHPAPADAQADIAAPAPTEEAATQAPAEEAATQAPAEEAAASDETQPASE
jgi:peptidyl-prolyl cis-trans isomerase C